MSEYPAYAAVILDVSINKVLDYGVLESQVPIAKVGARVEVPIRNRMERGTIYALKQKPDFPRVKPIHQFSSDTEHFTEDLFLLGLWIARYYCAPLHSVFKMLLPSSVRKDMKEKQQQWITRAQSIEQLRDYCVKVRSKSPGQAEVLEQMLNCGSGIFLSELLEKIESTVSPVKTLIKNGYLKSDLIRVDRSPLDDADFFRTKPKTLNEEQAKAHETITKTIDDGSFAVHLLYGITGSGKTEVYLQAIDKALALGKGTIMLVPEISLTAQTIARFRSRFEGHIAILHHRLSKGERFDEWHKIRRGDAKIVIGARSAIFSPVVDLGLIIVDEEHENSYKQSDEAPCYHARDVAVMRGKLTKASVILGSATPSLESTYNASIGKYQLSCLTSRAQQAAIPAVTIVDMQKEYEKNKGFTLFSDALLTGIKKRYEVGEQSILFLNRRGYHTTLMCQDCQKGIQCPHCDVSLAFHRIDNRLTCHLCGYTLSPPPKCCPKCKSSETMKFRGIGTEQVERAMHAIFPDLRTIRIDADTTRHKGSHEKLFRQFGTGKADLLIGTQMIAKGLHFPEVTLVGVLNSDSALNIPDFRASETVFQLITQVSGRSGRGALPGEVIIQTSMPENQTILQASKCDYEAFYASELETRKIFGYPPFSRMAKVRLSGPNEKQTFETSEYIRKELHKALNGIFTIHPTIAAGHARVKDRYHFQFLLRGKDTYRLSECFKDLRERFRLPRDMRLSIDIDPMSTYF
jgi:primosomal protein N' (replication factor Y)